MEPHTQLIEAPNAAPESRPRALVLCDAGALRTSLVQAFGPGYADIDPTSLAGRLADDRNWEIIRTHIYVSSDSPGDIQAWADRLKQTRAKLITQPGDIRIRMALDGTQALGTRQADILLVMGADASFMALAQDTRTAARAQNRNIKFASAFAPSSHALGRSVPSADYAVTIDRTTAENSLLLTSGPASPRRVYAGKPSPSPAASAPANPAGPVRTAPPPLKRRFTSAAYGVGFAASMLALIWEDVVASGLTNGADGALAWDHWRWGVSVILALGKSIVWPLYWLARAFGIEAG